MIVDFFLSGHSITRLLNMVDGHILSSSPDISNIGHVIFSTGMVAASMSWVNPNLENPVLKFGRYRRNKRSAQTKIKSKRFSYFVYFILKLQLNAVG